MSQLMQSMPAALDGLVKQIVQLVHPLQVVLFGSAARNELGRNSDIDVLVVMPEGTHRRRTAQELYKGIHHVGVPFDLIVATPGDLEAHKDNIGLIYRSILQEGRVVYAAQ